MMKNRLIIILVLVMVGIWGIFYLATYVWKVPELEYKYKKGEIYYTEEGKKQAWILPSPPISRFRIKGSTVKEKDITVIEIKEITENGEYVISGLMVSTRHPNMTRKGDIVAMKPENIFVSSQPRFAEGKRRSWNKTIHYAIDNVTIPANYKIMRKIFGKEDTYRIKTWWEDVKVDNQGNKYSKKLIGYSDFDAGEGKIIKMRACLEARKNGKLFIKQDAKWRLMSDEEIFKLSGIEKEWKLVVPGWENFDLSKDGRKLVWEQDINPNQVGDTEIWVAEADGTNARRLPIIGFYPRWSPDSSMIAYTTVPDMNLPPPLLSRELHVIDIQNNNDKKVGSRVDDRDYYWLPDGRLLFYEKPPLKWGLVNPEAREIKEIDETTVAMLYQDRWGQTRKYFGGRDYDDAIVLKDGRFMFYEKYGTLQWKTANPKTGEVIEIDKAETDSLHQEERFDDEKGRTGRWSPDRQLQIIGGFPYGRDTFSLKVRYTDGKEEILMPAEKSVEITPEAWSPDGRFFIYRFENRDKDMYSLKLYSLEKRETISQLTKWKIRPYITVDAWSSDGRYIYFGATHQVSRVAGIYRLRLPDEVVTVKKEESSQR